MINTKIHDDFEVEDLGIQEIDVYDIEVDCNHNFFGNNILLHNSNFFDLDKIVKKKFKKIEFNPEETKEVTEFLINSVDKELISPLIKEYYEKQCMFFNAFKNTYDMGFELISDSSIFLAKKKYVMRKVNEEGNWSNLEESAEKRLKVRGIEIVRSSTPQSIRSELKRIVGLILDTKDNELVSNEINKFKEKWNLMTFEEQAFPRGIKGMRKYEKVIKGRPIHVRASFAHNELLERENLSYNRIQDGDKIRFIYMKDGNPFGQNVLAFPRRPYIEVSKLVEEWKDVDLQWEKAFMSPLINILDKINFVKNTQENVISQFF